MRRPLYGQSRGRLSFGSTGWAICRLMSFLPLVKTWLWLSALATLAGWSLSALGQLNRFGYLVFLGICGAIYCLWRKTWGAGLGGATFSGRRPVGRASAAFHDSSPVSRKKDGDTVDHVPPGPRAAN